MRRFSAKLIMSYKPKQYCVNLFLENEFPLGNDPKYTNLLCFSGVNVIYAVQMYLFWCFVTPVKLRFNGWHYFTHENGPFSL